MTERDPLLVAELARLSPDQRATAEAQLALREQARDLAARLGYDPDDVYAILRHLQRSPVQRLTLGLRHGRLLDRAHRG